MDDPDQRVIFTVLMIIAMAANMATAIATTATAVPVSPSGEPSTFGLLLTLPEAITPFLSAFLSALLSEEPAAGAWKSTVTLLPDWRPVTVSVYSLPSATLSGAIAVVGAVLLIIVCTSMCAWWIVRTNNWAARLLYTLFLFNMIVPFQMVMFTLSKLADMMGLNTPWGLWIVYLGFGAGLAVFIFTGVVKGIPSELEESAMIDGASVPRIFFQIVLPIMRPSLISVAILQTMWIWNDFLLPYLTLDMRRFKTMSIAIQYLKGGYGSVDMGAMMACLVVAIVPIIIFYLCCQKYIIKGVMAGAVKG